MRTRTFFFALFFLCTIFSFAQQQKIDSLLKAFDAAPNDTSRGKIYMSLGREYMYEGDMEHALSYTMQSVKFFEQSGSRKHLARAYSNLGIIYHQQANYQRALSYYEKSLELAKKLNDKRHISILFSNLTNVYIDLGHYDKALDHGQRALAMTEEMNDRAGTMRNKFRLAAVYRKTGDDEKAGELIKSVLADSAIGDLQMQASGHYEYGEILRKKDKKNALKNYRRAYELYKTIGDIPGQKDAARSMADLGILKQDEVLRLRAIGDSLMRMQDEQNYRAAEILKKAHEEKLKKGIEEKKERLIQKEKELQEKKRNSLLLIVGAPVAGGIVLVVLVIILVRWLSKNNPRNKIY